MNATSASPVELTAGDVARLRNCDRKTAWRWLRQLERQHGPTVVMRRGNRMVTTLAALERVAPDTIAKRTDDRVRDLEQRIAVLEGITAEQTRQLQRLAEAWADPRRR